MEKFQNRYRIPSIRASWWDYSADGCYFITICVANRECLFGNVVKTHGRAFLQLSPIGKIVNDEWHKSFEIRNELFCDAFVIMPNHIHAILRIDNPDNVAGNVQTHNTTVETHGRASLQSTPQSTPQSAPQSTLQRVPKSISSFVAGFKSAATVKINELRNMPKKPVWQSRFHDRIIRNDDEYQRIIHYIYNNPFKWTEDEFYKKEEYMTPIPNVETHGCVSLLE